MASSIHIYKKIELCETFGSCETSILFDIENIMHNNWKDGLLKENIQISLRENVFLF